MPTELSAAPVFDDELVQERSLTEVYLVARRMPVSWFNQLGTFVVFALLILYGVLSDAKTSFLASRVRDIADYGFGFAVSMLSFLIAGFTVYLTVMKPSLILWMANIREDKSKLPWIKVTAFHFLRVMTVYVAFCLLCLVIKIFGATSGPLSSFLSWFLTDAEVSKLWIVRLSLALVGSTVIHLILLLQSFIFNIYATSMAAVCWERQNAGKEAPQKI